MKTLKLCWIFLLSALAFTSLIAKADPVNYYSVPVYYSKFVPKLATCTVDIPARYGFCGWANYPEEGEIGVTQNGKTEGWFVRLYDEVVCIGGHCETNYSEYRGEISDPGVTYWYVPKGFYLAEIAGKTTAIKYGNGPRASVFPIRNVQILPEYVDYPDGQYIPVEKDSGYQVFCNPAKECSYLGRVFNYADLKQYIPPVLTTRCDPLFCYTDDRIVGLNPKSPF